jgi:hypothetical protein
VEVEVEVNGEAGAVATSPGVVVVLLQLMGEL